ncbi:MAG: ATP-dependent RecD-like DNA helicase [Clostridia bacterium]|nr:ATP-dependent RecD-like DNA helicase [Clostridia bacterium]
MDNLIEIRGTVTNIIYRNEENGYCVANIELDDGGETVIVGTMPFLGAAEYISAQGNYTNHSEYGMQFAVVVVDRKLPSGLRGMYDYLSSKTVKGIGPKTARLIVDEFGEQTFYILANHPEELCKIKGISREKAFEMSYSFNQQNTMRLILDFLLKHELPLKLAAGIYSEFGEHSLKILTDNPYLLCSERFEVTFDKADEIAKKLSIGPQSAIRLRAALLYELNFNLQSGHVFIPENKLLDITHMLCDGDYFRLRQELEYLYEAGEVVRDVVADKVISYLRNYHTYENFVAESIVRLSKMTLVKPADFEKRCNDIQSSLSIKLNEEQIEALSAPFEHGISVITGGPGTGKTTTIQGLIRLFDHYGMTIALAAPTGRAAKRMTELCGVEAKTVHRLLEGTYSQKEGVMRFMRNLENPLDIDVLIVDEGSMVDMKLASSIFYALKHHTRVVFVGDKDQLPPVGSGTFFSDIVESKYVHSIKLSYVFRQGNGSEIVENAHYINAGLYPDLAKNKGDFYFASVMGTRAATDNIVSLMAERIPRAFGIPPENIQVITPTRQLRCGTHALNKLLQHALNPVKIISKEIRYGSVVFRLNDRVMQIKNNYDIVWVNPDTGEIGTGVFNGDTGIVSDIDKGAGILTVVFDEKEVNYSFDELNQIEHAYAITVHKSQGSEYDAVILPIYEIPERLMNRSILYTAITRAKKLLVIVGDEEYVHQMVDSNNKNKRYSALKTRIRYYYENT